VFVVRTPDGSLDVRVLDFGIAKLTSDTIGRTTGAMGSPLWMAPEEAKHELLTPAVDVWAFGLLAFYVLTGREIWRSSQGESTIAQALSEVLLDPIPNPILRAHSVGVTLPKGFDAWFAGCVVREVSVRFQSIHEAWTQLEAVLSAREVVPAPEVAVPVATPSSSISTNRLFAVVGGIAAVILLAVVSWNAIGNTSTRQHDDGGTSAASSGVTSQESELFVVPSSPPIVPPSLPPQPTVDPVLAAVQTCLDNGDLSCARTELERALANDAGDEATYYAQFLYDLCELQHASACTTKVKKQHPEVSKDPRRVRMLTFQKEDVPDASTTAADRKRNQLIVDATRLLSDAERNILEPKVMNGTASRSEADQLLDICTKQGDSACCANVRKRYPKTGTPSAAPSQKHTH